MKEIQKGSQVVIKFQGRKVKGEVISGTNWGGKDGWYIELTREDGGYGYWKQGPDGGHLLEVDGKDVCPHKLTVTGKCIICRKQVGNLPDPKQLADYTTRNHI